MGDHIATPDTYEKELMLPADCEVGTIVVLRTPQEELNVEVGRKGEITAKEGDKFHVKFEGIEGKVGKETSDVVHSSAVRKEAVESFLASKNAFQEIAVAQYEAIKRLKAKFPQWFEEDIYVEKPPAEVETVEPVVKKAYDIYSSKGNGKKCWSSWLQYAFKAGAPKEK